MLTARSELAKQIALSRDIYEALRRNNEAIQEVRKLRAQLREYLKPVCAGQGALADAIAELDRKVGTRSKAPPERFGRQGAAGGERSLCG